MIFLSDKGREYTYGDLLSAVNTACSYKPLYRASGLYPYFVNFLTALVAGAPVVLLDSDLSPLELDGVDERAVNSETDLPQHVAFDNIGGLIEAVFSSQSQITIFTSGTTGQPKEVVHTVQSLSRSVRRGDKYRDSIWAFAYNPTHMAGLQVFFQAFGNGNTIVNVFNSSRDEVFAAIDAQGITHISATPTFYRLLLPCDHVCPTIRRVTLGGEKSDRQLYDSIGCIFPNAKINNVYASTEAGSLFAARGDAFRIPPELKDKFKVVDGELLIHRSLLGYSENFVFTDDFYSSGDLVEWVDETAGLFRFKSRRNELINVGGYKVNPNEVEKEITAVAGVLQAVVYGKVNSVLGNVLCAEVVKAQDCAITETDLRRYLAGRLQDFKIPRRIKFVDKLSLTRTGKLKRT